MAERRLDAVGQDEVIPLRAVVRDLGADTLALQIRNSPSNSRFFVPDSAYHRPCEVEFDARGGTPMMGQAGNGEKLADGATDWKTAYDAVCRAHDGIIDFRGKLLALLPIASGAGIFLLLTVPADSTKHLVAISLYGVLITLGLFFYELRGIQKCITLREIGKNLEQKLLPRKCLWGVFITTKDEVFFASAETAALIIYPTVLGGWGYVAAVGMGIANWVVDLVVAVAVACGGFVLGWCVRLQQEARQKQT
jgi:hypothetical protein